MTSDADAILVDAINGINGIPTISDLSALEDVSNSYLFSVVDFFISGRRETPLKMPESTLAAFRIASRYAGALGQMGYPDQVHYQHFLVPNLSLHGETRKILSWLFFRKKSESNKSGFDQKLQKTMRTELKRKFIPDAHENLVVPFFNLKLQMVPKMYSRSGDADQLERKISEFRKRNRKIRSKITQYDAEIRLSTRNLQALTEQMSAISHPADEISNKIIALNAESFQIKCEIDRFQVELQKRCDLEERLNRISSEHQDLVNKIETLTISMDQNRNIIKDTDEPVTGNTSREHHIYRISQVSQSISRQQGDFDDITQELEEVKTQVNDLGAQLERKYHSMVKMLTSGKEKIGYKL